MKLTKHFFRYTWMTALAVAMLTIIVGMAISRPDVECYANRMERLMQRGDYAGALEVGKLSDKTDLRLFRLRMEALHHEGLLGERLFAYPVAGSGAEWIRRGGDYALCGYLIDKNLDGFVALLSKLYAGTDNLPRYYREALIQYNHLRSQPLISYHDAVMETDYRDMENLKREHADPRSRQMAVFRAYEYTYWYYFAYLNN